MAILWLSILFQILSPFDMAINHINWNGLFLVLMALDIPGDRDPGYGDNQVMIRPCLLPGALSSDPMIKKNRSVSGYPL